MKYRIKQIQFVDHGNNNFQTNVDNSLCTNHNQIHGDDAFRINQCCSDYLFQPMSEKLR